MYITFRRYKIEPKNAPEIIRLVNEGFVPILANAVGFVSYNIFIDSHEHICSVSTFTTRAGMEEVNLTAREWVEENLSALLPNAPEVSQGESVLHKRGNWL